MAITSPSQILNVANVKAATAKINDVTYELKQAIQCLENAKAKCGRDILETNDGNNLTNRIDKIINALNSKINMLNDLQTKANNYAVRIHDSQEAEYDRYVKEQAAKASQTGLTSV